MKIIPPVDPALLFQRFLVVPRSGYLSLEEVLTYGFSSYHPALIETREFFGNVTILSLLRQFETMLQTYHVRLQWNFLLVKQIAKLLLVALCFLINH